MSRKMIGPALIIIGVLAFVISLTADYIGLGAVRGVVGWKQQLGAGVGFLATLAGIGLVFRERLGVALMIAGGLVAAVALSADWIGLGAVRNVFGWKQQLGLGLGLVIALAGLIVTLRRKKR